MLPLLQVINQLGITYHVNDIFCLHFSLVFLVQQSTTTLSLFHSTASEGWNFQNPKVDPAGSWEEIMKIPGLHNIFKLLSKKSLLDC